MRREHIRKSIWGMIAQTRGLNCQRTDGQRCYGLKITLITSRQQSPRTHRIHLDWLCDMVNDDPGAFIRHIGAKHQLAGILTKGMSSGLQFDLLVAICLLGPKFQVVSSGSQSKSALSSTASPITIRLKHPTLNPKPSTTS